MTNNFRSVSPLRLRCCDLGTILRAIISNTVFVVSVRFNGNSSLVRSISYVYSSVNIGLISFDVVLTRNEPICDTFVLVNINVTIKFLGILRNVTFTVRSLVLGTLFLVEMFMVTFLGTPRVTTVKINS